MRPVILAENLSSQKVQGILEATNSKLPQPLCMKKDLCKMIMLVIILVFHFLPSFGQSADTLTIFIIRHGEKSNNYDSLSCDSAGTVGDNLSCRGLNRALALADVLPAKLGIPGHVYVAQPQTGKKTGSSRMFQTITPFAVKYNLSLNTEFKETQTGKAAKSIKKKKDTVLVVWEHGNIPPLVKSLGVTGTIPKWPCTDFDSIWMVTIIGSQVNFSMSGREGISPSGECP